MFVVHLKKNIAKKLMMMCNSYQQEPLFDFIITKGVPTCNSFQG